MGLPPEVIQHLYPPYTLEGLAEFLHVRYRRVMGMTAIPWATCSAAHREKTLDMAREVLLELHGETIRMQLEIVARDLEEKMTQDLTNDQHELVTVVGKAMTDWLQGMLVGRGGTT